MEEAKMPKTNWLKRLMSGYGIVLIVLIVIILALWISTDTFITYDNIYNLLRSSAVNGIVALAMTFVIATGGIDLAVGTNVGLSGMIVALLTAEAGMNMWLAMIIGLVACGAIGLLTGVLIHDGKLPPFIATMGIMTITRGAIMLISNARMISGLPEEFTDIGQITLGIPVTDAEGATTTYGLPLMALIWIVFIVICFLIIKYTRFGRNVFAIGSNEEAARLSGINVRTNIYGTYVWSALLCALGGILLTARMANGIPGLGNGYEMDAIAAAVVGGASLSGGEGSIGGTVVGTLLIAIIRNGGTLLGWNAQLLEIIVGALIIVAVLLDKVRKK